MSIATVRGLPPGGTKKQQVRLSDDGTGVEWDDPAQGTWEDIIIDGLGLRLGASAPDLAAFGPSGNLFAFAFDGVATSEIAYGSFEIVHSYKEGSDLYPHLHWAPADGNAGNVQWFFEYAIAGVNGTFGAPVTISVTQAAAGVAWRHQLASFGAIAGTGFKIGDVVVFRVYRAPVGAADTYGSDAFLLSIGIHFQQDTAGSYQIATKGYP